MWATLHVCVQLGSCTPSVECDPKFNESARAVIAIYAINPALGAMALCTGACVPAVPRLQLCLPLESWQNVPDFQAP